MGALSRNCTKIKRAKLKLLLNSFKKVDNFCLRAIDEVVVNSDEMKQYLIDVRKIDDKKISVIYHFANEKESPKSSKITQRNNVCR